MIEPSSTSLILLIFSSSTLFKSWGELVMITKNIANIRTAGTTIVRTGSTFCAALIAGGPPDGWTVAVEEPEIVDRQRLVDAIGDRLVDAGRAESPRSDLAVDRRREPVAQQVVVGLSE